MLIKPAEFVEDEMTPITCKPYFHKKNGAFQYADSLDVSRINQSSFTYLGSLLFQKPNGSMKLKTNLSVLPSGRVNNDLGTITTYAANDQTRAFRTQLKRVYGTGRRDDIPSYVFHQIKIEKWLKPLGKDISEFVLISAIPVAHSGSTSGFTEYSMKDCFNTIVKFGDVVVGMFSTMGMFNLGAIKSDSNYDPKTSKKNKVSDSVKARFEFDIDVLDDD